MSLKISYSNKKDKAPISLVEFKKVLTLLLKRLKTSVEFERAKRLIGTPKSMELHFCDDLEMRDYQKRFRNLDRTTDVLSFPTLESPRHNETGFLGSLIISLPAVERNSKRYKKTFKKELLEVYIHGVLHLLSFDHVKVSPKKKLRMRKVQKDLYELCAKSIGL